MTTLRSYSELIQLDTFEERLQYLYIGADVGAPTFGDRRIINQYLYSSSTWKQVRDRIIIRDMGCDLGVPGCDLRTIIVHHINPITEDDIVSRNPKVTDPENLICVSRKTHNYIHYGTTSTEDIHVGRSMNDTCPWKL